MQVRRSARTDRVLRFANKAVGIRVSVLSTALFLRLKYPRRYYPISDSALGARQIAIHARTHSVRAIVSEIRLSIQFKGRLLDLVSKTHFGRAPRGATVRPKGKIRWILSYAALRRCVFRAAGRRDLTAGLRRALPERLAAVTLAFALRTGLVFFFAIFAIVVSLPSQIYHCPNESRHLRQIECYSRR
jgi:hypothetical protein